jgi:hypothetical protein
LAAGGVCLLLAQISRRHRRRHRRRGDRACPWACTGSRRSH